MKTTIDLPETTLRQAQSIAAARGISLKKLVAETLEERVREYKSANWRKSADTPWMAGYGALADLTEENHKVLQAIEEEFETILPDELP